MIPLLAPLLGSMAGSLFAGTAAGAAMTGGIASALGGSTVGGLLAAAAPKAIGAGIGTLLAGGDLGDAALNAVGFGAAGAAAPAAAANAPLSAMGAGPAAAPAIGAATVPTAATNAAAAAPNTMGSAKDMMKLASQVQGLMGGGQQAPAMSAPAPIQRPQNRASDNPMLAGMQGPTPAPSTAMASMTVPSVGSNSMMPAAVGIGALPMGGQGPMSNDMMFSGMGPNQRNMANEYLRSQGMVGFA